VRTDMEIKVAIKLLKNHFGNIDFPDEVNEAGNTLITFAEGSKHDIEALQDAIEQIIHEKDIVADKYRQALEKIASGGSDHTGWRIEIAKQALDGTGKKPSVMGEVLNCKLFQLMDYGFPRAVGHTWAEINGVKNNPKAKLIVADFNQGKNIGLPREQFITINEIPNSLRGIRCPIVIDHYALQIMVDEIKQALSSQIPKQGECPEDILKVLEGIMKDEYVHLSLKQGETLYKAYLILKTGKAGKE